MEGRLPDKTATVPGSRPRGFLLRRGGAPQRRVATALIWGAPPPPSPGLREVIN